MGVVHECEHGKQDRKDFSMEGANFSPPPDAKKMQSCGLRHRRNLRKRAVSRMPRMVLGSAKEDKVMFALRKLAICASIGTLSLGGYGLPARAQELVQRTGPVGPYDTIMTTVGNKGLTAFYEPDGTHCKLYAVVFTLGDESGASATQVRMQLD